MAIGDNYISDSDIKMWMNLQEGNPQTDALTLEIATSISRDIEDHCHRQFNDAGAVSARVYEPNDRHHVIVDDFWTADGLIIQTDNDGDGVFETTWAATDYELRPLNGIRNGRPGWPYWMICRRQGSTQRFYESLSANVQVTAQWGWQSVPDNVIQAAKMLAADTFQMKDNRFGVAGSDQFGTIVKVGQNRSAQRRLCNYVRGSVFVA